jgi:hypothetical protein
MIPNAYEFYFIINPFNSALTIKKKRKKEEKRKRKRKRKKRAFLACLLFVAIS